MMAFQFQSLRDRMLMPPGFLPARERAAGLPVGAPSFSDLLPVAKKVF
jgi:hypothetical protein